MIIHVASKNPAKIDAVKEVIRDYDFLKDAEVKCLDVSSGVSEQPKTLEETIDGAVIRARGAFTGSNYSFGIENGLMAVPHTKTGFMNFCTCAIYDGKGFSLGLSNAFEYPKEITRLIIEDGLNASDAAKKIGLTAHKYIGHTDGIIGILTKGRLTRKEYTMQAVRTAIIHLENPELY